MENGVSEIKPELNGQNADAKFGHFDVPNPLVALCHDGISVNVRPCLQNGKGYNPTRRNDVEGSHAQSAFAGIR